MLFALITPEQTWEVPMHREVPKKVQLVLFNPVEPSVQPKMSSLSPWIAFRLAAAKLPLVAR